MAQYKEDLMANFLCKIWWNKLHLVSSCGQMQPIHIKNKAQHRDRLKFQTWRCTYARFHTELSYWTFKVRWSKESSFKRLACITNPICDSYCWLQSAMFCRLAVFLGEFLSFQYFKDTDPRETQKLKQEIETKNIKSAIGLCTILLILNLTVLGNAFAIHLMNILFIINRTAHIW